MNNIPHSIFNTGSQSIFNMWGKMDLINSRDAINMLMIMTYENLKYGQIKIGLQCCKMQGTNIRKIGSIKIFMEI